MRDVNRALATTPHAKGEAGVSFCCSPQNLCLQGIAALGPKGRYATKHLIQQDPEESKLQRVSSMHGTA
eukprot:1158802-Pelagomonas_calceolata.AAC.3